MPFTFEAGGADRVATFEALRQDTQKALSAYNESVRGWEEPEVQLKLARSAQSAAQAQYKRAEEMTRDLSLPKTLRDGASLAQEDAAQILKTLNEHIPKLEKKAAAMDHHREAAGVAKVYSAVLEDELQKHIAGNNRNENVPMDPAAHPELRAMVFSKLRIPAEDRPLAVISITSFDSTPTIDSSGYPIPERARRGQGDIVFNVIVGGQSRGKLVLTQQFLPSGIGRTFSLRREMPPTADPQ